MLDWKSRRMRVATPRHMSSFCICDMADRSPCLPLFLRAWLTRCRPYMQQSCDCNTAVAYELYSTSAETLSPVLLFGCMTDFLEHDCSSLTQMQSCSAMVFICVGTSTKGDPNRIYALLTFSKLSVTIRKKVKTRAMT